MLFAEIARSKKPLESLVRLALTTKGVAVTQGTIDRYTGLLAAAIQHDDGDPLDGNVWQQFVASVDGPSKFEAVCRAIGSTFGASSSEVDQFLAITDATISVLGGSQIDVAEAALADDLAAIAPTEAEAYAHLDESSRTVAIEVDRAIGAPNPARPEPSHIDAGDGGDDAQ